MFWEVCDIIGDLDCYISFAIYGTIHRETVFPEFYSKTNNYDDYNNREMKDNINKTKNEYEYNDEVYNVNNNRESKYERGVYSNFNADNSLNSIIHNNMGYNQSFHGNDSVYIPEFEDIKNPIYKSFTGNNISFNRNILLLTGPNMGGKSTLLRTIALNVILAQMGLKVSAKKMKIPIVDRIFTRLGSNDNLLKGESTFKVEMKETANMLKYGTRHSLMIVDELGRGTCTKDGECIVESVLSMFREMKCWVIFSTHYHNIIEKIYNKEKKVMVGYMKIMIEKGDIIFLYKLVEGICKDSHGIEVAKMAGVPKEIIEKAIEFKKLILKHEKNKL
jgi:DNA mismatch repair ATPase MutS